MTHARQTQRSLMAAAAAVLVVLLLPAVAAAAGTETPKPTHRMMVLVIQLGTILFAAKLGSVLFRRLRMPGPLGELVAGMLIGPFCLGGLAFYGFNSGLFPANGALGVSPELYGLCAIAAVVLMFNIGLETDLGMLLRYSAAGGLAGAGGVVASFFLGAGAVVVMSPMLFGRQLGLMAPECLFMGIITTATSVGITARILSERGRLNSPEGVTILSAAVIDDVVGVILLTVALGVVSASRAGTGQVDWQHIGIVAAKAVGVWVAATVLGLAASRRISWVLKAFGEKTSIAVMALGLALILAGLFEEAGLAMIIGAYVMGLSLSKTDISQAIREKLHPIYLLFVPVFFCVSGMRIDLSVLRSPSVLTFGLVYAFVALAAKVLGCGLPAMLANFNFRGAMRIGFGMAPRCEVALIIAGTALTAGVMGDELFAGVILMVLINTIVAPPVLTALFRKGEGTRKPVDVADKASAEVVFDFPSPETAEFLASKLATAFEAEGFFAYILHRDPTICQLRSDRTIIDLNCDGPKIIFRCKEQDVPLVNTAVYEAVAAVEQAVRGLKQPLDTGALAGRMQSVAPAAKAAPSLAAYLKLELIEPASKARTKADVIDELLAMLCKAGLVADREQARADILAREESMTTGLQHGVAIPHARTDAVKSIVCAVGLSRRGVDFNAIDGEPSRIFLLTLSPKSRATPHMRFMSKVGQLLDDARRPHLLAARTRLDIYGLLCGGPIPESPPPGSARAQGKFRLSDYVRPEMLSVDLKGETAVEVIDELLALAAAGGRIGDLTAARAAVLAREEQMPTGLEEGVAIPHGRTDAVDRLVCAAGIHREGVWFGAADSGPAHVIVVALTPRNDGQPYLQFLAAMMSALHGDGRAKVLAAETAEAFFEALTGETADPRP